MRYYSNRELAGKLGIKLARWKRWSREFLAPDPLGGLQSGYARQLSIDDAFTVYLGGHLVNELKFGIQAARQVLGDLYTWLGEVKLYETPIYRKTAGDSLYQQSLTYQIYITAHDGIRFTYTVRGILDEKVELLPSGCIRTVRYREQRLGGRELQADCVTAAGASLLNISSVHTCFLEKLANHAHDRSALERSSGRV